MKKFIILTLMIIATIFTVSGSAFAETVEQQISKMATVHEKVTDAKSIVYERACVVAIKTEKFTTKSEYNEYVKALTDQIKNKYEIDVVIVTRNPKVMQKINQLEGMSETERKAEIEKMIEHELKHREPPFDKVIMPRFLSW